MVLWGIAGLGLFVALVALASVRRLARKVDGLNQSYWELRYDYTRLRSQVSRLDPEAGSAGESEAETAPSTAPSVSFVPLSSIRKKNQ